MSLDSKIVTPVTSLEGWLVVAFVAIAFFVIALFAYKTQKKADSTASYFAAGRGVPWQVACLSLVASWTWATTTMAAGEGAYTHGFAASWYYPIGGGIGILIAIPILNRVRKVMPYGLTFPEFIRRRIGPGRVSSTRSGPSFSKPLPFGFRSWGRASSAALFWACLSAAAPSSSVWSPSRSLWPMACGACC